MNLWNIAALKPPDRDFSEYSLGEVTRESLSNFVSTLTSAAETIGPDHPVWGEIRVFQALQLRLSSKLPCDKFLHIFQMVGRCLQRMIVLDLSKLFLDLAEKFLSGLRNNSETVLLPSRSQLEYLLIRIQAASKLLCETLSYSRETFCYLIQRLSVGHMLQNFLMACSVIARMSVLLKALLLEVCSMYQGLKPWCGELQGGTCKWDMELELPDNLWQWLKPEENNIVMKDILSKNTLAFLKDLFGKNKPPKCRNEMIDIEDFLEDCIVVEKENKDINEDVIEIYPNVSKADIGEVVPRKKQKVEGKKQVTTQSNGQKSLRKLDKKIFNAKTFKSLWTIWENICKKGDTNHLVLLQNISPTQVEKINHLFILLNRKMKQIRKLDLTIERKKEAIAIEVHETAHAFSRTLGLENHKSKWDEVQVLSVINPSVCLKPTESFKQMKKLFDRVYFEALLKRQYKFCKKFEQLFKPKIKAIKTLKLRNGKESVKTETLKVSKELTMYREKKL